MEEKKKTQGPETPATPSEPKGSEWVEPKLTYLEPKLTEHGELKDVTGFFGPFSP
jgi:hypothetical protein